MAQTIKLKRNSANNDTAPVASDLAVGEIAVNSVSGKLYTKKSDDSVVEISGSGGGGGGTPELTFTVTVAQVSGANKFHLAGTTAGFATATAAPVVDLQRGFTYKFDQSDSSNSGHELVITASSTGGSGVTAYTTGVTTTGTVGVDRVLTFVVPHDAADTLYYQCNAHASMGNELDVGDTIVAGAVNLPMYDEDTLLSNTVSKLNFTGTGVTATYELESVTSPGDPDWAKVTALISGGETVASGGSATDSSGWGGTFTTFGDYKLHAFTSSGTFTPTIALDVDVLLVAGGGGAGGGGSRGAGGAGGLLWQTGVSVTAQGYSIVVGAGGTAGANACSNEYSGGDGGNSTGFGYTAIGGGGAGSAGTSPCREGRTGGSGGGANYGGTGGSGTAGQGNAGGNATTGVGGGGGGAGSAASGTTAGAGADHSANVGTTYGESGWFAGGGGGANNNGGTLFPGGQGGGGDGGDGNRTQGTDGTGGGGGAGYIANTGKDGGNGVVIVRYLTSAVEASYTFSESSPTTPHTVTVKGGQTALDTTTVPAANGSKPTGISYGGAMKFDGTDDYYTIPSDADFAFGAVDGTDNDFTIESWVYLASDVAGDCVLFDGRTAATNAVVPLLEVKSNKLTYTVNNVALLTDSADLTTNTWHHIAIQRSATVTVLIKNGTTVGTNGGTTTASTYVACPWTIGASSASTATAFFKGWMEEWRVTKGKARYTVTTTGSTYSTDYDPSTWTTVFPTSLSTTTTTPTVDVAITGGGSGSALIVKDENTTLVEAATQIGFTGTGVTATGGNNIVTVDVPGGTLPSGGSLGQVLAKSSADSGDAGWIDVSNSATMTNTSTETYFEEVGNGTNVTSTTTTPGDTYWADTVFFARGTETVTTQTGDDDWSSVKLLVQSEAADGTSTFVDASDSPATVTVNNYTHSTTQYKFGNSSAKGDADTDYIKFSANSKFEQSSLGANATIEGWFYITSFSGDNRRLYNLGNGNGIDCGIKENTGVIFFNSDANQGPALTLNTWTHIAWVVTSGTLSLYINGVSQSISGTTTGFNVGGTGDFYVGSYSSGSMANPMYFEEFRVSNIARYSANFDDDLPDSPFPAQGSGTIFTESSGTTAHTVNLIGGANQTTGTGGKFLEGWNFDGTDDYWTIDSNADFGFGAVSGTDGDFTIETWIYADASNTSDFVVFDGRTAAANADVPLLERKSNKLTYTVNGTAFITDPDVLPTDAWTHIAVERSGSHTHLFVGGSLKASKNNDTTTYATCPFRVGASSASTAADFFKGKMDDFRISTRARFAVTTTTSTETVTGDTNWDNVTFLSQNQNSFDDQSTNNLSVTATGATLVAGSSGGAMTFDPGYVWDTTGSGNKYVVVTNTSDALNMGTSDYSIEFWARYSSNAWAVIIEAYTSGSGDFDFHVGNNGAAANQHHHRRGGPIILTTTSTDYHDNTWDYYHLRRESGTLNVYVNDTSVGSATDNVNQSNCGDWWWGYFQTYARQWRGQLGPIRVTKGVARTHAVPTALFIAGSTTTVTTYSHSGDFTPTTSALPTGSATTTTTTTAVPGDIFYSTGKVGIGTSLPAYDLDVVGNVNYTGNLYQNGELIQPASKTWSNMSPSGVTGETDDSVGDANYNYVQLLLHMNAEGTAYTTVTDHSKVPSTVVFTGDAQLKPVTAAVAASGDANWTDVHLLISPRTAAVQDESTNSITITNT